MWPVLLRLPPRRPGFLGPIGPLFPPARSALVGENIRCLRDDGEPNRAVARCGRAVTLFLAMQACSAYGQHPYWWGSGTAPRVAGVARNPDLLPEAKSWEGSPGVGAPGPNPRAFPHAPRTGLFWPKSRPKVKGPTGILGEKFGPGCGKHKSSARPEKGRCRPKAARKRAGPPTPCCGPQAACRARTKPIASQRRANPKRTVKLRPDEHR